MSDKLRALGLGRDAEDWVADALVADGWQIVDRNWRSDHGELDLVAERAGVLRFVEVKARAPGDASALESIDARKRALLRYTAEAWLLARAPRPLEVAFLVVAVERGVEGFVGEWIDDAF